MAGQQGRDPLLIVLVDLPLAHVPIGAASAILLGTVAGFLSGAFGVGGGFIVTPVLILLGVPAPVVVGTQANQMAAASFSGMLAYLRRGQVDLRMGVTMLLGSVLGAALGVGFVHLLPRTNAWIIPVIYILTLGMLGLFMLRRAMRDLPRGGQADASPAPLPMFDALPLKMHFDRSALRVSILVPTAIGAIGGLMVSVLGVGGGFAMIPAMIYMLGMAGRLASGTALFQLVLTSVLVTFLQAAFNHSVDAVLLMLLLPGGVIGAQAGVRVAMRMREDYARLILAAMILLSCATMAARLAFPSHTASLSGGNASGFVANLAFGHPVLYAFGTIGLGLFFAWAAHRLLDGKAASVLYHTLCSFRPKRRQIPKP